MKIQLVIVSHGEFARGIVSAAEMICGPLDNVLVYSLMPEDSPDEWRKKIRSDFVHMCSEDDTRFLVLADLFGGSPCTNVIRLMPEFAMDIITGMNLGMLLEIISNLDIDDIDYVHLAKDAYDRGCVILRSEDYVH